MCDRTGAVKIFTVAQDPHEQRQRDPRPGHPSDQCWVCRSCLLAGVGYRQINRSQDDHKGTECE